MTSKKGAWQKLVDEFSEELLQEYEVYLQFHPDAGVDEFFAAKLPRLYEEIAFENRDDVIHYLKSIESPFKGELVKQALTQELIMEINAQLKFLQGSRSHFVSS